MQRDWIVCDGNPALIVLFLGWGAGPGIVEHIRPAGCDVLCLSDYRSIEPLSRNDMTGYSRVVVAGWSFGVWAAEQALCDLPPEMLPDSAVAFCGSPFPVDRRYGIDPRRMAVTLRGFRAGGMDEFLRRTYGVWYDHLAPQFPVRPVAELIDELEILAVESQRPYSPSIAWDRAVIGAGDEIFPRENLENYWLERAEVLPLPHYPFGDETAITRMI